MQLTDWAQMWQLAISINKCCVLNVGKTKVESKLYIDGCLLPFVTECRDLGVTMTSDLSMSNRISVIVAKAHQRANIILCCFVSRDRKLLVRAFEVYVRPILEYNSVIWSPVLKKDIVSIEKYSGGYTKRLPGLKNLTYQERLKHLNLSSLELRRLRADLVMCYKIVFGLVSVHCTHFLQLSPLTHTRGHPYKLFKQHSITSVGSSFFGNRVINVWNNLAQDTVDFTTLQKFKTSLMSSDLSQFLQG